MAERFFYCGDVSIENGGYFYSLANWGWQYANVVRVTPCSDAGASDNCYWVEHLTVNIREGAELESIIASCGWIDELPKGAKRRHMLIDAHIGYGAYDVESSECVQIGAKQSEYGDSINVDRVLRGNASLRNYARQQCKAGY